ncbi:uncharacterized protein C2orf92 homolog [Ailuropoda melanoleuca]|uniref:uncharacterized protein C2orf92 homolog n=1 Tax=Ailuropoda melanoleuca TaxID=9646 RepID=UPI00149424F5|nr:uncharacterized protein C2orf92 homolog [Ailuropoda melanoleuca]
MRQKKSNDHLKVLEWSTQISPHLYLPYLPESTVGTSCSEAGYPQKKNLKNTEFVSSSNKQEEHLSKLFDEILQQVFYKVPYETPVDEARTADFIRGASVAEPGFLLGSMDRISTNGHNSEKRDKESSLSSGDINEPLSTVGKATLEEAVRTDVQNKNVPCAQLLQFLQRNIVIAAASVAGVLVVTVLLLLALTTCIRRKQLLHPPANMTYNIFILSGKTWWQKFQEKNPRKHSDKQKQLLKSKSVLASWWGQPTQDGTL